MGAWCALGFMLGELPNSFVKRQLDIAPGGTAPDAVCAMAAGGRSSRLRHRDASRGQPRRPRSVGDLGGRAGHRADLPLGLQRPDVPAWPQTQTGVRDMSSNPCRLSRRRRRLLTRSWSPLGGATDVAECGNKAANLARLLGLGVPVPPGVVVTNAALEAFLDEGALRDPIAELCRDLAIEELDRPGGRRGCHPRVDRRDPAMSPAARGDRRSGASARTRAVHGAQLRAWRGRLTRRRSPDSSTRSETCVGGS